MLVRGLREAESTLRRLDIAQAMTAALDASAQELEAKVIEALSQPPGADHSMPWQRSGALRASIDHEVNANTAVVGSYSMVAVDQELGTSRIPPRPFLGSTAAATADELVASIAVTVARRLADG